MSVKLLTYKYLEFLSLKEGRTVLSEFKLVKIPHCWKSHVTAQIEFLKNQPQPLVHTLVTFLDN